MNNFNNENVRTQSYEGEIKKCPNCGSSVGSFSAFCSSCGHEFSNSGTSQSIKNLTDKLEIYSASCSRQENNVNTDKKAKEAKYAISYICFFGALLVALNSYYHFTKYNTPFIGVALILLSIIFFIAGILILTFSPYTSSERERDNFILMFPIPNTKNDILEMAILAKSQIVSVNIFYWFFSKSGKYQKRINTVWEKKLIQILEKAKLSFANDSQTIKQFEEIVKSKK